MCDHVNPGAFNRNSLVPEAQILLKDGLFCEDDIGKVDHLVLSHGRIRLVGEFYKVLDGIKYHVDGLRDIVVEVVELHLLSSYLLRCYLAVGIK